jgi:hypothetical protein
MLVALRAPVRFQENKPSRERIFSFLARRFNARTVFMEIGGADCALALRAAGYVERVYVIDVSGQSLQNVLVPCNVRLVLCDGVRIPVPEASVHLAWSGPFMDHLHHDDVLDHLTSVRRALTPGGEYICSSAHPARFLEAGFSRVRCYLWSAPIPWAARGLMPKGLLRICARK